MVRKAIQSPQQHTVMSFHAFSLFHGIKSQSESEWQAMEHNNIHIGQLIRTQLKVDERSVSWLAREIGCSRKHLYKVFRKPSLDGELLLSISLAMNFNFFQYYSAAFYEGMKERLGETKQ